MNKFHRRCGDRVTLLNQNITAIRNFVEFNHGLILGADPLVDDVMFEVRIDRKVNVWNGSLEIGVTTLDPEFMELPATATKLRNTAWILSGNSIVKDGVTIVNVYGPELDTLREGDCVGVTRSSKAELLFFINGRCLGVAAKDLPSRLFAVIDLYGQCVQVSIMHNNYPRAIESIGQMEEYVEEDSDRQQQGEAAAWSIEPKDTRETFIQMPLTCPLVSQDHLRFHPRCGILVKLSANNKTAERARPLDDYNNGVVMTHRPLYDNELFEIRIDRLVDKWSGSIEVGVTTHNPATIRFPSTMTNMDSGTIMMSGCKLLLNGHGTCMEYGNFNLDELREADTVGMMRKSNGKLHYFINGIDQGVATDKVPSQVWGVIDLYGMTVKVTIVDPCEDLDSNINHLPLRILSVPDVPSTSTSYRPAIDEESLLFHTLRDSNVIIINDGKTAHRPNAFEFFNNGIVMTNRTLKTNELFQVRLDLVIPKWAGSIEIGVTQNSSKDIKFPFKLSNAKGGTWAVTGEDVIRDGTIIIPQYVRNLNKLVEGDTVGVMRKDMGILHFFVNGIDQGPAAFNIPEHVFGIIDLYGRVAQATIVDIYSVPPFAISPDSPISTGSNTTVFPEMCFHRVHGRNARLSRNRLTASRATVYSEFNDAVLFSSRPLRECDMFELRIDKMVDCWIGSLEIGVTAIRPDDLEASGGVGAIAGTATDLSWDTYILSGAAMMKDGECVRSVYPLDLDTLTVGSRVGMMWHADRSLHYYLDGMDMGKAWYVPHLNIYAVVDLYGQCTQVTILQNEERAFNYNGCNSDHGILTNPRLTSPPPPYWSFSEYCGENVVLMHDYTIARRMTPDPMSALVFSSAHLIVGEIFEIKVLECKYGYAGSFRMGITDINILNANVNRHFPLSVSWLPPFTAYVDGKYMKYTRPGSKEQEIRSFVPSFEWLRPGDRIGLKKTADSRVIIYYNSEPLEVAFEKVPDKVYVLMEMFGHVTKIQTVSRGTNIVPSNQQTIPNDNGSRPPTQASNPLDPTSAEDIASDIAVQEVIAAFVKNSTLERNAESETHTMKTGEEETAQTSPESGMYLPSAPPMADIENTTPEPDRDDKIGEISESEDSCSIGAEEVVVEEPAAKKEPPTSGKEASAENATANMPAELRRGIRALPYTFHYMHGRNIRLCSSDTVAMRIRGHAEGIAIASQPLRRGNHFRFRVDKITNEWQGTMCIGAVAVLPNEVPPRSALHIESPAWVITNDVLMNRGSCGDFGCSKRLRRLFELHLKLIKRLSEIGRNLDDITENSVLTLHFRFNSELTLEVDGVMRGTIAVIPRVFTHIYPTIDLYGRIIQVSILLHPHVILGGNSLDLPVIEENFREDSPTDYVNGHGDDDDESPDNGGDENSGPNLWNEYRNKRRVKRNYYNMHRNLHEDDGGNDPRPGPSSRPDNLPCSVLPRDNDAKNKEIKCRRTCAYKISLHHSLILPDGFVIDNDEAAKMFGIQKSQSTQNLSLQDDEDEDEDSQINPLSIGSRMGDDEDSLAVETCDTNIRHNDRYPEANDVDNLDNEIVDALTLETGNLPDLTEEQSPSIDESTRRDDFWADGLSIENLNYLNDIICWNPDETGPRFAERDWVFYSETNGNCEHMHLALKYWNYLVLPYPDMREVVASGQVRCYCHNCLPDAEMPFAGWVRIERAHACGTNHVFWHVVRSTLVSASALSGEGGESRRPRNLADQPSMNPPTADIWFDEEGKPHHTVLALDIDSGATEAEDRLLAYMIFLRSHITFSDDAIDPLSFED